VAVCADDVYGIADFPVLADFGLKHHLLCPVVGAKAVAFIIERIMILATGTAFLDLCAIHIYRKLRYDVDYFIVSHIVPFLVVKTFYTIEGGAFIEVKATTFNMVKVFSPVFAASESATGG
jgi:hypothetical protein